MIPDIYPKEKPQAVLFDWDSTLVDTWKTTLDSINAVFEKLGQPSMTAQEFLDRPHYSMKDMSRELFGENWEEHVEHYYKAVRECHIENLTQLEGALPLLKFLKEQNIYSAVVSNKHGEILRREVDHLGWDHHFGAIIGSHDLPEDKPSSVPLLHALKPADLEGGHHVWFVGDSIVDVKCAKNAGCVPIVVGHGEEPLGEENIVHARDCQGLQDLLTRVG